MKPTDRLGNDLTIGDKVVFESRKYRERVEGIVVGFTSQKVRVEFRDDLVFKFYTYVPGKQTKERSVYLGSPNKFTLVG